MVVAHEGKFTFVPLIEQDCPSVIACMPARRDSPLEKPRAQIQAESCHAGNWGMARMETFEMAFIATSKK